MTVGSDAETGNLRNGNSDMGSKDHLDAGAVFVLESKGLFSSFMGIYLHG